MHNWALNSEYSLPAGRDLDQKIEGCGQALQGSLFPLPWCPASQHGQDVDEDGMCSSPIQAPQTISPGVWAHSGQSSCRSLGWSCRCFHPKLLLRSSVPDERRLRLGETPAAPGGNPAGGRGFFWRFSPLRGEATFSTCHLIPLDCSSKTFHRVFFPPLRFETWTSRSSKRNPKIALSNKTPVPGVSCHSHNCQQMICSSS